jgi:hypothetical protein
VKTRGWHGYKLHPPGRVGFDLAAYHACREAVGPDFKLMADPVAGPRFLQVPTIPLHSVLPMQLSTSCERMSRGRVESRRS